jgi:excinuclease ABC subunit A
LTANQIRLRHVRVNNLKNVSLDIPLGQWLSVCGLSGSGKSSLAFDTLYAEGQRRYLDCLSPSTRRFLVQLDKPDADSIEGLPPAIAVRPSRGLKDRKSTVGSATEVIEYLRLLYAKIAHIVCPVCQTLVEPTNAGAIAAKLQTLPTGMRFMVAFGIPNPRADSAFNSLMLARKNGFSRAVIGNRTVNLSEINRTDFNNAISFSSDSSSSGVLDRFEISVVVDRLTAGTSDASRIRESVETAIQFGLGDCIVFVSAEPAQLSTGGEPIANMTPIDGRCFEAKWFSMKPVCITCQRVFPNPEPRLFNFVKPESACETCNGVGFSDAELLVTCLACQGHRLQADALAFQINDRHISGLCQIPVTELVQWLTTMNLPAHQAKIAKPLLDQIFARLNYLVVVGVGYLTLGRPLLTVSNGESQRLLLTSCLSSSLVNMLYVLDEPSTGLHAYDLPKIVAAVKRLHQNGNTVVVVDHHPKVIDAAERVVEIGPGAGEDGGQIVFDGTFENLKSAETKTGQSLRGARGITFVEKSRKSRGKRLQLFGATGNNLKSINVDFPLGCLCVVTGVSGAGKSTLVRQTLYPALQNQLEPDMRFKPLPFSEIAGSNNLDEVISIDSQPIGRSGRSNPVIFVKAFDEIRQAMADTADAKLQRATPGHFSFNVAGGRCEKCQGDGSLQFDMQFLSDVFVTCDECQGTRYRKSTLQIKYRGLNVAEILNLTAREAFSFFRGQPKVQAKLKSLIDVGLDYIRLGQPANTLSGGESHRLKLALHLNTSNRQRTLFIIEEPTVGLHPSDVTRLLDAFDSLIGVGHSIIVVEHNLQVIRNADWIIDLGPGAGPDGGQMVVAGTPKAVAQCPDSLTGRYLFMDG